jgi:chromosome segregation ATPase
LEGLQSLILEDCSRLVELDSRLVRDRLTEEVLRHRNEVLSSGIEQLKLRLLNKSRELNQLRTFLSRSQHSLERLRPKRDKLAAESDKMEQMCDQSHRLLSHVQDLTARKTQLSAEIGRLKQNKRTDLLQSIEVQHERDGARAAEIAATIDAQNARISELTNDQLALKTKISRQEQQFQDARDAIRDRISQLQSAPQPQVEQLRAESADCDAAMRRLKVERKRSEAPLETFRERKVSANARSELNQRLKQKLESMRAEIEEDKALRAEMTPESEVRIARLKEELAALSHRRRQKRRTVEAIREEAARLKAEAAQLQEDLQLAEAVLEKQEREKSKIVGALRNLQLEE